MVIRGTSFSSEAHDKGPYLKAKLPVGGIRQVIPQLGEIGYF